MSQIADPKPTTCRQPACPLSADGRCLEGLDPQVCPHVVTLDKLVDQVSDEAPLPPSPPKTLPLPSGIEVPLNDAGDLLARTTTRVVLVAGDNDAGKTTLLTSLFDRFCTGPYGGYLFAGSSSLIAFERRAHTGYTRSEAAAADTVRTAHSWDIKFLHLRLRDEACRGPSSDLLLSDIDGETCKRARDSAAECAKLTILRRADRLLLVIDGDRLSTVGHRESAISDAVGLLRRFLESSLLRPTTPIDLVVSKWDKVAARDAETPSRGAIKRMKQIIDGLPVAKDVTVTWHEIAARPDALDRFTHCHGMDGFPVAWCDGGPPPEPVRRAFSTLASRDMDTFVAPTVPAPAAQP